MFRFFRGFRETLHGCAETGKHCRDAAARQTAGFHFRIKILGALGSFAAVGTRLCIFEAVPGFPEQLRRGLCGLDADGRGGTFKEIELANMTVSWNAYPRPSASNRHNP